MSSLLLRQLLCRFLIVFCVFKSITSFANFEDPKLRVAENWSEETIFHRFGYPTSFYSSLISLLTVEGPLRFISNATYRKIDRIETEVLTEAGKNCRVRYPNHPWRAFECAAQYAQEYGNNRQEVDGLCRVYAEALNQVVRGLNIPQFNISKRAMALNTQSDFDIQHVLNIFHVKTSRGTMKYIMDLGNFEFDMLPLNELAKNYHELNPDFPALLQ